jgi:multiple sugar transport system ATP-binding protein
VDGLANLVLENITKVYDNNVPAVSNFDLKVADQEFIVFVGPSGCGKSTTLRMIAGLEDISSGNFYIDGKRMNDVAPKDRDIAMVFQNYALYPHMSVYENMAFGLKLRKFPKDDIDKRVKNAAEILGLENYLDRKPKALSGGQRQRVALGRAIVRDAKLFLMDEPLSNLDSKLRVQMRAEIAKLHLRLKTTTIYVTHDQTEAMTMASRIVVMKDGLVQQIGTPKEVYDTPDNVFVGGFIGSPSMNFFNGKMVNGQFVIDGTSIAIPPSHATYLKEQGYEGKELILGIRPEHITSEAPIGSQTLRLKVEVSELTGAELMVYSNIEGQEFIARIESSNPVQPGESIDLSFDVARGHFFDKESELRIK